jgi:general secretion pathway protein I
MRKGSGFRVQSLEFSLAASRRRARNNAVQGSGVRGQESVVGVQGSGISAKPQAVSLPTAHCPLSTAPSAFSILEVILALAILAGAMVVLGELARMGFRNAKLTQDLTRAQLLCESKMAEFTSGISLPQTVQGATFDDMYQDGKIPWIYSVEMEQIDQDGLIALRVTVSQNLPAEQRPATFSLSRWITDPGIEEAASTTEESTSGSSSGTGMTNE